MKIFLSHNSNDQVKIDQLSSSLKELQSIVRDLKLIEKEWEYHPPTMCYTELFDCKNKHASPESIFNFYSQTDNGCSFERKATAPSCSIYSDRFSLDPACGSGRLLTLNSMIDKTMLIDRLVETSKQLLVDDRADTRNLSRVITEHIELYNITENDTYLYEAIKAYTQFSQTSKQHVRIYKGVIHFLKKKRLAGIKLNLRQLFRNKIKFLFKNMDADEDSTASFIITLKQAVFNFQKHLNGQQRNYSAVRLYYKI